jgi:multiple sugar transport system substrate-binding protein
MRKTLKHPLFFVIICALLVCGIALILIGVFQSEDQPIAYENQKSISFAIYGDAEQRRIITETVKYFESENNCKVEIYSFSTIEALQTRVLSQYSAGDPFDVFYVEKQQIQQLKKKIVPLDDILSAIQSDGDVFIEATLKEGRFFDIQYALPTGVRPYCIFYNEKVLAWQGLDTPQEYMDSKEWDLDKFDFYCREVYEKTGQPAYAISPEWQSLYSFIIGNEGEVIGFDENNKLVLDDNGTRALTVLSDLIELGAAISVDNLQWGVDSLSLFRSEGIPMVAGSIDYIYELYEPLLFEWDVVPMPMISADYTSTVIEVPQIAAAKGGNVELAKKFVMFFVSSFGQKVRLEEGERLMSSLNMAFYTGFGDVHFPDHSNYLFFIAENGKTLTNQNLFLENKEAILLSYQQFINGETTLEDFIVIN